MPKYKDDGNYTDLNTMPYARVSTDPNRKEIRYDNHKKKVWHLEISDFLKAVDPHRYFVTTGEAVRKARQLEQDLLEAYQKAKLMADILEAVRAPNVYLETRWENGNLLLIAKNPRSRKDKKEVKKVSKKTTKTIKKKKTK